MKKPIITLFLTTAVFFCLPDLGAQTITINASESSIHWLGRKVTGQHEGSINLLSGSLIMDNELLIGGDFVVDMNTISAKDLQGEDAEKLEESLKSDEWFGVAKHPQAKLVFTSVESQGEGLYKVIGNFKIKGKTNPIAFEFQVNALEANAKVIIDRTLYNILDGSNSFFESLKDKVIYDDFEIDVNLKF
tara:strand:- start:964 stop:1533 length:570 start_codon:yes stop_codon:yes gene_type:complete